MLTKRKTALLGALLSASLVVGLGLVAAPAANAAAGDSKISVNVGSYRNTDGSIASGTGAVLGLSTASTTSNSWTDLSSRSWGTCVVNSASLCTFTIPSSAQGDKTRFLISMVSAHTGASKISQISVGGSSPTAESYVTEVTPGQVSAGVSKAQTVGIGLSYEYKYDKKGDIRSTDMSTQGSMDIWASQTNNPAMVNSCGLKVGLLIDLSSSMKGSLSDLKTAATSFVTSLTDTPSTMSIFTFGTASPASGMSAPVTGSLSTTAGVKALKDAVSELDLGKNEATNWDAGFRAVTAANKDLDVLLVLTDGQPTKRYGNSTSTKDTYGTGNTSDFGTVEAAVFSANSLKKLGTRVQMVGIGSGLTANSPNLDAVSGGADGYSVISDYDKLAASLKAFTDKQCAGTITVIKKTIANGANVSTAVPAAGFTFGATMSGGTLSSGTQTSNSDGIATFSWTNNVGQTEATATITEVATDKYTIRNASDGKRASCVVAGGSGKALAVTNVAGSSTAFSIKAPMNSAITCTVINEKVPDPVGFTIVKTWKINGVTYTNAADLPINVSSSAKEGSTNRPYDTPVMGRTKGAKVTIVDSNSAIPKGLNCSYNSPAKPASDSKTLTLATGLNTFTFEAVITCKTTLAASHTVTNGDKPASDWKVTATPSSPAISGNGSFPVTTVPGNTSYTLAATNTEPYAPAYVQKAWTCTVNGVTTTLGSGNSVSTPMGTNTVCATSSYTSVVTLTKKVKAVTGSTVVPSDWTLNLSPLVKDSTPAASVAGSATGTTILVRPDTEFTLGETVTKASNTALKERFVLDNLECATGSGTARTVALNKIHTVAAEGSLKCTFTNAEFGLKIKKTAWHGTLAVGVNTSALIPIPSGSALPLPSGTTVSWTYEVTNTGVLPMKITKLVDDRGVAINCGQLTLPEALAAGTTLTCVGTARLP